MVVDSPVNSLIRPQLWIHWSVISLCLLAWGGLLYLGDLAEQTDFGLREIVGLRSGRLATFFSTLMLLWAGQLALLIFWYRRKSRNDFHGRYRSWLWAGVTLQLFLMFVATGAQHPFSEYMQQHYPLAIPRYDLLCWLVPIATVSLSLFRLLGLDMRPCRSSRALMWVAGIAAIVAGSSLLLDGFLPARWQDLLQVGSATLCHLALASSLLLHARFVIHVNNEAPPGSRRPSVWSRLRDGLPSLPRLRRPRRQPKSAPTEPQPAEAAATSPPPAEKPEKTRSTARLKPDSPPAPKQAPAENTAKPASPAPRPTPPVAAIEELEDVQESRAAVRRDPPQRPAPKSAAAPLPGRIDPEEDDDEYAGLSKKERRRLRKQQREGQRTDRSR